MSIKPGESTANGTITGYRVEAMHDYHEPLTIGDQTFTREWKIVEFSPGACGVPVGARYYQPWLSAGQCVSYQAAQALRWWLHASAEADGGGALCLRSRIVKFAIKYSFEVQRQTEHCQIGGEDRSNFMPDWGNKAESREGGSVER